MKYGVHEYDRETKETNCWIEIDAFGKHFETKEEAEKFIEDCVKIDKIEENDIEYEIAEVEEDDAKYEVSIVENPEAFRSWRSKDDCIDNLKTAQRLNAIAECVTDCREVNYCEVFDSIEDARAFARKEVDATIEQGDGFWCIRTKIAEIDEIKEDEDGDLEYNTLETIIPEREISAIIRSIITPAEELKAIRKNAGLTQAKLAERFNIPLRTIEDWESGKHDPAKYIIDMIEEILNK